MANIKKQENKLLKSIVTLIDNSKKRVAVSLNSELTLLYWNIGEIINENVLFKKRADYGENIIKKLSKNLTSLYGNGFSKQNLHYFIRFNEIYNYFNIVHSLSAQLT